MTEEPIIPENQPEPESYKQALGELDSLLRELELDVDVDLLVAKVERGAFLLKFCQAKLNHTELKVKQVLEGIGKEE